MFLSIIHSLDKNGKENLDTAHYVIFNNPPPLDSESRGITNEVRVEEEDKHIRFISGNKHLYEGMVDVNEISTLKITLDERYKFESDTKFSLENMKNWLKTTLKEYPNINTLSIDFLDVLDGDIYSEKNQESIKKNIRSNIQSLANTLSEVISENPQVKTLNVGETSDISVLNIFLKSKLINLLEINNFDKSIKNRLEKNLEKTSRVLLYENEEWNILKENEIKIKKLKLTQIENLLNDDDLKEEQGKTSEEKEEIKKLLLLKKDEEFKKIITQIKDKLVLQNDKLINFDKDNKSDSYEDFNASEEEKEEKRKKKLKPYEELKSVLKKEDEELKKLEDELEKKLEYKSEDTENRIEEKEKDFSEKQQQKLENLLEKYKIKTAEHEKSYGDSIYNALRCNIEEDSVEKKLSSLSTISKFFFLKKVEKIVHSSLTSQEEFKINPLKLKKKNLEGELEKKDTNKVLNSEHLKKLIQDDLLINKDEEILAPNEKQEEIIKSVLNTSLDKIFELIENSKNDILKKSFSIKDDQKILNINVKKNQKLIYCYLLNQAMSLIKLYQESKAQDISSFIKDNKNILIEKLHLKKPLDTSLRFLLLHLGLYQDDLKNLLEKDDQGFYKRLIDSFEPCSPKELEEFCMNDFKKESFLDQNNNNKKSTLKIFYDDNKEGNTIKTIFSLINKALKDDSNITCLDFSEFFNKNNPISEEAEKEFLLELSKLSNDKINKIKLGKLNNKKLLLDTVGKLTTNGSNLAEIDFSEAKRENEQYWNFLDRPSFLIEQNKENKEDTNGIRFDRSEIKKLSEFINKSKNKNIKFTQVPVAPNQQFSSNLIFSGYVEEIEINKNNQIKLKKLDDEYHTKFITNLKKNIIYNNSTHEISCDFNKKFTYPFNSNTNENTKTSLEYPVSPEEISQLFENQEDLKEIENIFMNNNLDKLRINGGMSDDFKLNVLENLIKSSLKNPKITTIDLNNVRVAPDLDSVDWQKERAKDIKEKINKINTEILELEKKEDTLEIDKQKVKLTQQKKQLQHSYDDLKFIKHKKILETSLKKIGSAVKGKNVNIVFPWQLCQFLEPTEIKNLIDSDDYKNIKNISIDFSNFPEEEQKSIGDKILERLFKDLNDEKTEEISVDFSKISKFNLIGLKKHLEKLGNRNLTIFIGGEWAKDKEALLKTIEAIVESCEKDNHVSIVVDKKTPLPLKQNEINEIKQKLKEKHIKIDNLCKEIPSTKKSAFSFISTKNDTEFFDLIESGELKQEKSTSMNFSQSGDT